jgi:hypothetical protein
VGVGAVLTRGRLVWVPRTVGLAATGDGAARSRNAASVDVLTAKTAYAAPPAVASATRPAVTVANLRTMLMGLPLSCGALYAFAR